jgi:hypothetical protein
MIAIECISNLTLAACLKLFCREIILAAFLNMCNAAENFFRLRFEFCEQHKLLGKKINFSSRSAATGRQKGFAVGLVLAVESPVAVGRAPCFASLTFDGG